LSNFTLSVKVHTAGSAPAGFGWVVRAVWLGFRLLTACPLSGLSACLGRWVSLSVRWVAGLSVTAWGWVWPAVRLQSGLSVWVVWLSGSQFFWVSTGWANCPSHWVSWAGVCPSGSSVIGFSQGHNLQLGLSGRSVGFTPTAGLSAVVWAAVHLGCLLSAGLARCQLGCLGLGFAGAAQLSATIATARQSAQSLGWLGWPRSPAAWAGPARLFLRPTPSVQQGVWACHTVCLGCPPVWGSGAGVCLSGLVFWVSHCPSACLPGLSSHCPSVWVCWAAVRSSPLSGLGPSGVRLSCPSQGLAVCSVCLPGFAVCLPGHRHWAVWVWAFVCPAGRLFVHCLSNVWVAHWVWGSAVRLLSLSASLGLPGSVRLG